MVAIVVQVLSEALVTELLRLKVEAMVEAKAKDLNKDKTKDQPVKLPDLKDPKIIVLPDPKDQPVKLQDHKGPLVKLQDQKGLLEVRIVEAKIVEVKEAKKGLKVKLQGLKDPKDLKLKVKLQDHNKSPTKDHHRRLLTNSLMQ